MKKTPIYYVVKPVRKLRLCSRSTKSGKKTAYCGGL